MCIYSKNKRPFFIFFLFFTRTRVLHARTTPQKIYFCNPQKPPGNGAVHTPVPNEEEMEMEAVSLPISTAHPNTFSKFIVA